MSVKPEEKSQILIDENFNLDLFYFCQDENNGKREELFKKDIDKIVEYVQELGLSTETMLELFNMIDTLARKSFVMGWTKEEKSDC